MRSEGYELEYPSSAAQSMASERAAFVRRVYMHLAGSVLALIGVEAFLLNAVPHRTIIELMFGTRLSWLVVMLLFMGAGFVARVLAQSRSAPALQYAGLGLYIVAWAIMFAPLIIVCNSLPACQNVFPQAGILTGAVFGGLTLASPVILFQIWRFVTPGLKASERRYAIPFVLSSFVLFLAGAATAYVTLPHALGWLKSVGGPNLQAIYDPIPYLGLILLMMTIFGLTFEFPVILVSLELAGVVTPSRLLHSWRWAVIIIVVVAAVFTPSSDPFSMFALAVPLIAFYFISIGIGKLLGR